MDASAYSGTSCFSDVSATDWYSGAINWVASMGYMNGMGDGTFGASNSITREQICVALANYAGLSSSGNSAAFNDDSEIAPWAKSAVYACRDLGIVTGMGGNTFAPKSNAQRAQACTMVLKAYDLGL